jgi:hypothetical protein
MNDSGHVFHYQGRVYTRDTVTVTVLTNIAGIILGMTLPMLWRTLLGALEATLLTKLLLLSAPDTFLSVVTSEVKFAWYRWKNRRILAVLDKPFPRYTTDVGVDKWAVLLVVPMGVLMTLMNLLPTVLTVTSGANKPTDMTCTYDRVIHERGSDDVWFESDHCYENLIKRPLKQVFPLEFMETEQDRDTAFVPDILVRGNMSQSYDYDLRMRFDGQNEVGVQYINSSLFMYTSRHAKRRDVVFMATPGIVKDEVNVSHWPFTDRRTQNMFRNVRLEYDRFDAKDVEIGGQPRVRDDEIPDPAFMQFGTYAMIVAPLGTNATNATTQTIKINFINTTYPADKIGLENATLPNDEHQFDAVRNLIKKNGFKIEEPNIYSEQVVTPYDITYLIVSIVVGGLIVLIGLTKMALSLFVPCIRSYDPTFLAASNMLHSNGLTCPSSVISANPPLYYVEGHINATNKNHIGIIPSSLAEKGIDHSKHDILFK